MKDLQPVSVTPFDHSIAETFVGQLLRSTSLSCDEGVPNAVLQQVAPPIPHWIQVLVHYLTQDPQTRRSRRVRMDDVARVYREDMLGPQGRQFFSPYEEQLSRGDPITASGAKSILTYLASVPYEQGATRDTLEDVFRRATGSESVDDFNSVLTDLELDFFLRYDDEENRWFFTHKVLYDWWRRWHPPTRGPREP